jgi:hypothetical protein
MGLKRLAGFARFAPLQFGNVSNRKQSTLLFAISHRIEHTHFCRYSLCKLYRLWLFLCLSTQQRYFIENKERVFVCKLHTNTLSINL